MATMKRFGETMKKIRQKLKLERLIIDVERVCLIEQKIAEGKRALNELAKENECETVDGIREYFINTMIDQKTIHDHDIHRRRHESPSNNHGIKSLFYDFVLENIHFLFLHTIRHGKMFRQRSHENNNVLLSFSFELSLPFWIGIDTFSPTKTTLTSHADGITSSFVALTVSNKYVLSCRTHFPKK